MSFALFAVAGSEEEKGEEHRTVVRQASDDRTLPKGRLSVA